MPYTYCIRIANRDRVQVEVRDLEGNVLGNPSGKFCYTGDLVQQIQELRQSAQKNELKSAGVEALGELLFAALFDETLRRDFFEYYDRARQEDVLLRVELDVDEHTLADVAALPWEFLRVPADAGYGQLWFCTSPDLVLSRRRTLWKAPKPIQLQPSEHMRIALAVAAPKGLDPIQYKLLEETLKELSLRERIELIAVVNPADKASIDMVLGKKPHIFHFIGHARFLHEAREERGQIALVDSFRNPEWIDADDFSDLFNRHQPGIVVLDACETGALSATQSFAGIASQIIQQNVPVVVAMQYEISNVTAQRFGQEFYRRLSDNDPVDKAVQEGRRHIALGPYGYNSRDFATPELVMRVREGQVFQRETMLTADERDRLMEKARIMEKNVAYQAALKILKDVRDFGPDDPYVLKEIERLQQRNQQNTDLKDLKQQLSKRYKNIKPLFGQIMNWFKRMERGGLGKDDDIVMKMLKLYLSGKIPAEEFMQIWQALEDKGEFLLDFARQLLDGDITAADFIDMWKALTEEHAHPVEGPRYDALADRLRRGELIPVIGAGIYTLSEPPQVSTQDLVQELATKSKYRDFAGSLSIISHYYQKVGYTRSALIHTVQEVIQPKTGISLSNLLYSELGTITRPIVVISATYDNGLEQCFRQAKKPFAVISHIRTQDGLSRLLLKYSNRPKCEPLLMPEDVSRLNLLEQEYSIIYKIIGCLSLCPPDAFEKRDSLLIAEEDFFDFAKHVEKAIPGYLTKQFSRRSLLFLGYDLKEWQDRLILTALMDKHRNRLERSYAVHEQPEPYETICWKSHDVDLYRIGLDVFVENLRTACKYLDKKAQKDGTI